MMQNLKPLFGKLTNFAKNRMGFDYPPKLFLKQDMENSKSCLGRTAHYDPAEKAITIFTTGRHPKDILRSFAHELVHHTQNLRGDLSPEKCGDMGNRYAQENPHMRKMEEEAYLVGNMCFRDWEDNEKFSLQESKILKENKTMTTKITKESLKEMIRTILNEKMETVNEEGDMFAPNHYCIHHGGVQHEGKIVAAEAVQHNYDKVLGKVTHYDMKLPDGTILENVAAEDIQVTNATLESSHSGKRDDGHKPVKKMKVKEEEEIGDDSLAATKQAMADLRATDSMAQDAVVGSLTPASAKKPAPRVKMNPDDPKYDDNLYKEEKIEEEAVEEEVKNPGKYKTGMEAGYDKDGDGVPNGADSDPEDGAQNESKIQTPEQENTLYESRFAGRNTNLFEDLVKKWAK